MFELPEAIISQVYLFCLLFLLSGRSAISNFSPDNHTWHSCALGACHLFFFWKKRREGSSKMKAPPLSLKVWRSTKSCYTVHKVEGPRPPRIHSVMSPLASCCMASTEGERPRKMTSLRWLQMDHRKANMLCHSAYNRYGPSLMDLQKASQEDISIWATLADNQTDEELVICSDCKVYIFFPAVRHFFVAMLLSIYHYLFFSINRQINSMSSSSYSTFQNGTKSSSGTC